MKFHAGSRLWIEVTAQHGCGVNYPKTQCDIIIQCVVSYPIIDAASTPEADALRVNRYMCDDTATGETTFFNQNSGQTSPMKDGTTTGTVTRAAPDAAATGRHEPVAWWDNCKVCCPHTAHVISPPVAFLLSPSFRHFL